jgi:hypothetical protein
MVRILPTPILRLSTGGNERITTYSNITSDNSCIKLIIPLQVAYIPSTMLKKAGNPLEVEVAFHDGVLYYFTKDNLARFH